jgi:hypothetical protein
MSNTLTNLQPTLYSAAQEVSNTPFGIVSAISANFDDKGVAIGDKVTVPVAPVRASGNYSPTMNLNNGSTGADAIAAKVDVEITANKYVSWHLTGEQEKSLANGGTDKEWFRQLVAQGMRQLRNDAEADAYAAVKVGASRAIGTAGTTPFATGIDEIADLRKLLRYNGAPMVDPQLIMSGDAAANYMKTSIYQLAYSAGSDADRRAGVFGRQYGFTLRDSAGITLHDSSSAANYATNGGESAKAVSITVGTGTDAINAGDVFSLADRTGELYVVSTAQTGAGELLINRPGLIGATATAQALTFTADYTPCLAFERSAVVGVMRPPYIPANPAIEQMTVSDQFGMTYLLCRVVGDGVVTWRLHLAYGFKVVQPEHVVLLLG